jgi:tRNA (adenine22-N1)-methyltransferase
MVRILTAFPDRVPSNVVVQPNRNSELLREWAIDRGFHLVDEQFADGCWRYTILRFKRGVDCVDPAYQGVNRNAALLLGPHFCKRNSSQWREWLSAQKQYLNKLDRLGSAMQRRLDAINFILETSGQLKP